MNPLQTELTGRALVMGWLSGALLAVTNTYMGLKTGFWESGCVLSSLLAFGGLMVLSRRGAPSSPLETNLAQTAAVSMGAMPASAGLLGSVPALVLLGLGTPSGWAVALWGVGLGMLGVLFAFLLRRRLLEEEALPFPTGAATSELISTLHAQGSAYTSRAWSLGTSTLVSAALTWLRDARALVPPFSLLPATVRVGGIGADQLLLGIGWSPMMLGIGVLVGTQAALSLLLGSLLAWIGGAPWLVNTGIVPADAQQLRDWLLWPGVGLIAGGSMTSLVAQGRSIGASFQDLRELGRRGGSGEALAGQWVPRAILPVLVLTLVMGWFVFRMGPLHFLLALLFVFPLCAVCARAAGQADLAPMGPVGQLAQVGFGAMVPQQPGLNIAAGALTSGAASHTCGSLWSLQAGRLLGASASRQLLVQLSGLLLGAAVAVPTYHVLVSEYGLRSSELPMPTAGQFQAVATLASQGLSGLPERAAGAMCLAFGVGVVLSLPTRGRLARLMPSAAAMGIGFFLPVIYTVTLCLGALVALVVGRLRPSAAQPVQAAAAGSIVGESLLAVLIPVLRGLGVLA